MTRSLQWVVALGALIAGSAVQPSAPEALSGLDPVLLLRGERQPGREEHSVIYKGHWYRFDSTATLREFERDPDRFSISLGGVCARMGGVAAGDPSIFSVHKGRIFVFSNSDCQRKFEQHPDRFVEESRPPLQPTNEEAGRARSILDRAAVALGGDAALQKLGGYRLRSEYRLKTLEGELVMRTEVIHRYDGYYRRWELRSAGPVVMTLSPGGAFTEAYGHFQLLGPGQRAYLEYLRAREPISLLRARHGPGVVARPSGPRALDLEWGPVRIRLVLDERARLRSMSYRGRGPDGIWGDVEERYSDYRDIAGLTSVPFRVDATWDGIPDIGRSVQAVEWVFEPVPAISEFSRPVRGGAR